MIFSVAAIAVLASLVSAIRDPLQKQFESTYKSIQTAGSQKEFGNIDVVSRFCETSEFKQDCLDSSLAKWEELWNEIAQFEQDFGIPFVGYVSQRGFGYSSEPAAEQAADMIDALFLQMVEQSSDTIATLEQLSFGEGAFDSIESFIKAASGKKQDKQISKLIASSPKQFVDVFSQAQCKVAQDGDTFEAPEDMEMSRDNEVNLYRRGFADAALFGSFGVTNIFAILGAALLLELIGFAIYGIYNVCSRSSCCR